MSSSKVNKEQIKELLYQALETELGGEKIYKMAISCAVNSDLKEEWQGYLEETQNHQNILLNVFKEMKLDPEAQTPGRAVTKHIGESLVKAMKLAADSGDKVGAELVAAECVVLAETKDHSNWSLIGLLGEKLTGSEAKILKQAHEAVGDQEDHHLFHTRGWGRELWIDSMGLPAMLPPPEELKQVDTEIGAVRAKNARDAMMSGHH